MKRSIVLVLIALLGNLVSGCNTMQGLGKDVERLGEKVQAKSSR